MQFSAMVAEVLTRLNENQSSPTFWTAADVKAALNEGLEEFADATEYYEVTQQIPFAANETYYDTRAVFTREPLLVTAVFNDQTSRWLRQTNVDRLDTRTYPRWGTITGEAEQVFFRDLFTLGLFPKPAAASGSVTTKAAAMPPPLSLDTDTPGFPAEFHYGLVEYALYTLRGDDGEVAQALYHYQEFVRYQDGLLSWVRGRVRSDRTGVIGNG